MKNLLIIAATGLSILGLTSCEKEDFMQGIKKNETHKSILLPNSESGSKVYKTGDDDNETFFIRGKLTNSSSSAIAGANLDLLNLSDESVYMTTTSNSVGDYQFEDVLKEAYILEISAVGYQTLRDTVPVTDSLVLNYVLIE